MGNEIGLGVIPMGREVRAFVDALGRLNQAVAQMGVIHLNQAKLALDRVLPAQCSTEQRDLAGG